MGIFAFIFSLSASLWYSRILCINIILLTFHILYMDENVKLHFVFYLYQLFICIKNLGAWLTIFYGLCLHATLFLIYIYMVRFAHCFYMPSGRSMAFMSSHVVYDGSWAWQTLGGAFEYQSADCWLCAVVWWNSYISYKF